MARKEIHCYQTGRPSVDEDYCLKECDSPQRGFKSICPESVNSQMDQLGEEAVWKAIDGLSKPTRLALTTYSDLLEMGGEEAAEMERGDLVKDVPEADKDVTGKGMAILLSRHRAGEKKGK